MELDQRTLDGWVKAYPGLEDLYPATGMQLGLVFHSLLDGGREAYATQIHMDFEGAFDAAVFRLAWEEMLARHASFRTAFVGLDREQPLQLVVRVAPLEWREEDWRALDLEAQEEAFARYREYDKRLGFDFGRAPLMRMSLMRLSQRKYRWLWTHHHSLLDGWSIALVLRELLEQYEGLLSNRKITLLRRADYRDYIAWLGTQDHRAAEAYWRDALSEVTPTRLDLAEKQVSGEDRAQAEQGLVISAPRTEVLRKVAQHHGVTLNTVVQGAWAYLLHRYNGERDVVFGQTVSGRSAVDVAGIEAMVGLFINTLPTPVEIARDADIGEWLRRLQQEQAQRESHGYLPLVEIQRLLGIQAGEALFDTLLVFQNFPVGESLKEAGSAGTLPRLKVSGLGVHEGTGYDLTLVVVPARELSLRLLYQRARHNRETIAALLGHLGVILDGLADAGITRVGDLPYLTETDYEELVERRNGAAPAYPHDECIHELFEAQVRLRPDAIALVYEGGELTYGELNRRANRCAHQLIECGVGPEVLVGLCMEPSAERLIGILGILKAGGCCVPLDPEYPEARLEYMVAESGCLVVLSQQQLILRLPFLSGMKVLTLDTGLHDALCGAYSDADIENSGVGPTNLAYVVYTSGSTGEPAGAGVTHRSLHNLAVFQSHCHGLGGKSQEFRFASLLSVLNGKHLESVNTLASGGESTTLEELEGLRRGRRLVYVLDGELQLVPPGAVGELCIGGDQSARGYLNRAGLTADRFVPHPFTEEPGERLYRTGDLVRHRVADGKLEVIGRVDHQMKVRGHRTELEEIESVLRANAAVREAVVVTREHAGEKRLVGYVVAKSGMQADDLTLIQELRRHIQEQGYRVPSALMVLSTLPLTANGKVERKALPVPQELTEAPYTPPEGVTEELLAELWCRLLKHERVGRQDSFFELGGHSLLATQLASRIRETFSTELPLRELFEHPTLSSQARAVERSRGAGALVDVPMEPASREQPLPLSYAQQRLWFLYQYMGPSAVYNMSLALRLQGEVDEAALKRSLEELHRRHESLRTRFESRDGAAVQVIDPPGLELEVEAVPSAAARAIAHAERFRPFDLSSEPLCRARLLREAGGGRGDTAASGGVGDYVLLVTMHHSVSDGWSLGVFFRELMSLYQAYTRGEDSPLAPLPIQYADYAQWQRRWLQGAVLEQQLSYWRERLTGLPPLLTLPTDRPRPAEQTFRGSIEYFALPAAFSEKLQTLSREQGVTLYMTLLSALAVLLGRYAGQQDVAVGSPIANRTRRETEGLIGFFVNTLVMRHDLHGDPRFIDVLQQTREAALQAYAHQDVPFEQLMEELNPQRSLSHSPLFQVMFALQNAPFEALELPGLAVQPLEAGAAAADGEGAPEGTARFDLTLSMQESSVGLVGVLEYNTDLFERSTIRRMLGHYTRLLEAVVVSPQARLSYLQILSAEERQQQLVEWNATTCGYPRDKGVHELFEEQADRSPEAIAVVEGDRRLTYREVNSRSNALAHCLIERGVTPGSVVGLCVAGDVEWTVGLLGILKAGGVYVRLNPDEPAERFDYLLEDSGAELIVTQASLSSRVQLESYAVELGGRRCLELEGVSQADGAGRNPGVMVRATDLACVRYEADAVGVPLGRMISHLGLVENLLGGGQASYAEWKASSGGWNESSGKWLESLLPRRMDWSASVATQGKGRSAAHYVLDGKGELLPVGTVGELYVGGEGMGWGYRVRAGLTADRFVPNAFSEVPGERLYRTGKRARWRMDGTLEFIGREEEFARGQEKREEQLEIERALLRHEAVHEAVVVQLEAAQGKSQLAAYVVEREPGAMPVQRFIAQLKSHLRTQPSLNRLPEEWRVLDALPRTAAGAVDRSGLPSLDQAALKYVAPRTKLEKTLVEVWRVQLGIERVGIEDNYFALGGDSIRSISLVAQARQRGVEFSIRDLFAYPTVSGLASAIERGDVRSGVIAEEIKPFALLTQAERERLSQQHDMEAVEDAYPLSMIQQGMVLESQRHEHLNVYLNFHIYAFKDTWDRPLFERALRHLISKHSMLRTYHEFSGERPLQLVLKEGAPPLNVVDVRDLDQAAIQNVLDQWTRSELSTGLDTTVSLWRAAVHVSHGEQFLFCICLHHALSDGWSTESFATELYATYGQLKRSGYVAEYLPLPSYKEFVALEQSALSSAAHRAYWTQQIEGASVPWWTGRKKSASTSIPCEISEQTSHALVELARSLGVQERSVWCSVYLALLACLSGTEEAVGTVMTQGRPEVPGGDRMFGVFLNALPVRAAMSGRWLDLIAATERELTEQHAYRHYPLAEIQRLTGLDFSAAVFNYSNWHVYYEGVDREGTREEWIPQKVGGWQETNYLLSILVHKDDKARRYYIDIGADTQVFDAAFRERIREYAANIIRAVASDATAVIDKTALLTDAERDRQVVEWNATARAYPDDRCVHELFEEQALLQPDAIALVHEDSQLSYGELNRRANRLAHCLRARGVGADVRLGVCMERSPELAVGLLGILKAGGCYVPLDPDYPQARLEYMLAQSGCHMVLSKQHVMMELPLLSGTEVLLLDADSHDAHFGAYSDANVAVTDSGVDPANLAYVIYTSGSTGQPKGIAIVHRNIGRLIYNDFINYASARTLLCAASPSFDAITFELWGALLHGGRCVLAGATRGSFGELGRLVERQGVDCAFMTTALFNQLIVDWGESLRNLKCLLVGGEAASIGHFCEGLRRLPETVLNNIYGPTENTTFSCTYAIGEEALTGRTTVPMGGRSAIRRRMCWALVASSYPWE